MTKDLKSGPHRSHPIYVAAVDNDEEFLQEVKSVLNGPTSCFSVWTFKSPEEFEQTVAFAQSTEKPVRAPVDLLLFDINFAIAKSIHTPKKFDMTLAEFLAKDVVAHLLRSKWKIERKPPIEGHGISKC